MVSENRTKYIGLKNDLIKQKANMLMGSCQNLLIHLFPKICRALN